MWRDDRSQKVEEFFIRLLLMAGCFVILFVIESFSAMTWYGPSPKFQLLFEGVRYLALLMALAVWFVPLDRFKRGHRK